MNEFKCPKCGGLAEELAEEVDIGVGIQRHVYGAECPECGQIALCHGCGAWDFQKHMDWCGALLENQEQQDESSLPF